MALLSLFQSFDFLIQHKPFLIESNYIEVANYGIGVDTDIVEELVLVAGEGRTWKRDKADTTKNVPNMLQKDKNSHGLPPKS